MLPLKVQMESVINRAASECFVTLNVEQLPAAAPSVFASRTCLLLAEE